MHKRLTPLFLALVALALLVLPGCVRIKMFVHLNPDGSGTLEQQTFFAKELVLSMAKMGMMNDSLHPNDTLPTADKIAKAQDEMFKPMNMDSFARTFGEGVRFVAKQRVSDDFGYGEIVTFAFADINKLHISMNNKSMAGSSTDADAPKADDHFLFHFTPGSTARLTITPPIDQLKPKTEEKKKTLAEQKLEFQQMTTFLKGMQMQMAIDFKGTQLQSDATRQQGNRIMLYDVDMDKLAANGEPFIEDILKATKNNNIAGMKALSAKVPGLFVETKPVVTASFR